MKKSHFFVIGDFYVIFDVIFGGLIPTKSPFCMVVVLVLKSWDWQTPPPPQLGQNPKFFQKIDLRAPLSYRLKLLTREETQAQRSLKLH